MSHRPIIHVLSYAQISSNEIHQLMPFYHIDRDDCALAMPRRLVSADEPWDAKLRFYKDWIQSKLKIGDAPTKAALDNIYDRSINGGIIIATLAQCVPFWTHAHIVRDIILELAGEEGPST